MNARFLLILAVIACSTTLVEAQKAVPGNSEQLWTTVMLPEQFHISLPTEWVILPPDKDEPDEVLSSGSRNGSQLSVNVHPRTVGKPPWTTESIARAMTTVEFKLISKPKARTENINGIPVIIADAIVEDSSNDQLWYQVMVYETEGCSYWVNLICPTSLRADWEPTLNFVFRSLGKAEAEGCASVKPLPAPEMTPTMLGEYSIVIDGHFSIDIGDDWERHRENGSSAKILFRGSKKPKGELEMSINIAFNGIADPKRFLRDEHAEFLTNAHIKDTMKMFSDGNVSVTNTKFRIIPVSGISAMQIDISATYSWRTLSRDFLERHTYLLFGDGRLYRVTLFGFGADRDFKTNQIINSIVPVVKPDSAPTSDSSSQSGSGKSI